MKHKQLNLSDELHALIIDAARAKYPQFSRPGMAWIRETLEREAKKELSKCTKSI
jgi:hypothetical protein